MKILYFAICFFVSFLSFGQCPTNNITLSSQADVDAFATNYPGCTDLDYRLAISGSDITDLSPLSILNSVTGLLIKDNLQLTSLQGLNLSEISYAITQLDIENNPMLMNISDLSSTTFEINTFDNSSGEVRIKDNPFLGDLIGLEGLPEFVYSIYIQNNNFLEDLTGLSTVKITEDLVIENNAGLTSFSGFSSTHQTGTFVFTNNNAMVSMSSLGNITPICGLDITNNSLLEDIDAGFIYPGDDVCGTYIDISNNPNLLTCSSDYLCSVLALASDAIINNNAMGCNSPEEVETQCPECPTQPLMLSSQSLMNAFLEIYPNCTELDIDLSISGNDITDLSPLSNIESIHSLRIENNPQLQNLSGLNSITHIDGYNENNLNPLFIGNNAILTDISSLINMSNSNNMEGVVVRDNPLLQSLNGLQGFNNFIWLVDITNNDSLTDLVGLNNVVQTDDFVILNNENLINLNGLNSYSFGDIEIENNASLQNLVGLTSAFEGLIVLIENPSIQSLQGLEQASSIYGIYLDGNDALFDISAINAFTPENGIYFDFVIKNNSNLSVCNVEAVCSAFALCNENGEGCELVVIENNNADCESKVEVALNCGLVPSNDDCSTAIEVNLNETLQAYNDFATQSSQVPSCNDVDRLDVWFTFSSEIPLFVDIMIDDSYYMQVWEGTCENLTQVPNTCLQGSLDEFSIAADTDYFVQVWSDDSTSRMSSGLFDFLVQDATLSLDDDFKTSFIMFPNPVEDVLEFKSNKIVDSIEVYNVLGQNVLGSSPNGHNGKLDLSSLNSGVYFIKVEQLNVVNTFRIIKE